jgi:hypothetical protein
MCEVQMRFLCTISRNSIYKLCKLQGEHETTSGSLNLFHLLMLGSVSVLFFISMLFFASLSKRKEKKHV